MSAKRDEAGRERPILFSGPMVRAILDGKKTQTRRVVKDLKPDDSYIEAVCLRRRPYGVPGDLLWVRETWTILDVRDLGDSDDFALINYAADDAKSRRPCELEDAERAGAWLEHASAGESDCVWRPSIHMPRWASRLTLEVTDVRVERLQDISEDDAKAEGVPPTVPAPIRHPLKPSRILCYGETDATHVEAYRYLWDHLNAKRGYGWNVNPWVWVIDFRPLSERAS